MGSEEKKFLTVEAAAERLSLTPKALRDRLRRAQSLEKGEVVAYLGAGVRAVRLGRSWRVLVPSVSG